MLGFFNVSRLPIAKAKPWYYGPIDIDSARSPSMLKAFVNNILLAEITSTWFHASPTSKVPSGRHFGTSLTAARNYDAAIALAQSYRLTVVSGFYGILQSSPLLFSSYFRASCSATRLYSKDIGQHWREELWLEAI